MQRQKGSYGWPRNSATLTHTIECWRNLETRSERPKNGSIGPHRSSFLRNDSSASPRSSCSIYTGSSTPTQKAFETPSEDFCATTGSGLGLCEPDRGFRVEGTFFLAIPEYPAPETEIARPHLETGRLVFVVAGEGFEPPTSGL